MRRIAMLALILIALVLPASGCSSVSLDYQAIIELEQNVKLLQSDLAKYVQADETLTEAAKANRLRTGEISLAILSKLKAKAEPKE